MKRGQSGVFEYKAGINGVKPSRGVAEILDVMAMTYHQCSRCNYNCTEEERCMHMDIVWHLARQGKAESQIGHWRKESGYQMERFFALEKDYAEISGLSVKCPICRHNAKGKPDCIGTGMSNCGHFEWRGLKKGADQ
jgi:hypothetical protein